jgi:hypothetical protein
MKKQIFFYIFFSILLAGCSHNITLKKPDSILQANCGLSVYDSRPEPEIMTARTAEGVYLRILIKTDLSSTLDSYVCHSLESKQKLNGVKFTITDFDCTSSGFLELSYIVDLRGRLEIPLETPVEIRSWEKHITTNGYVPTGCEVSALNTVISSSKKISALILNNQKKRTIDK